MGFQVIKFQGDSIRTLQTTSDGEFVNCQDLFKALGIKYSSRKVKKFKTRMVKYTTNVKNRYTRSQVYCWIHESEITHILNKSSNEPLKRFLHHRYCFTLVNTCEEALRLVIRDCKPGQVMTEEIFETLKRVFPNTLNVLAEDTLLKTVRVGDTRIRMCYFQKAHFIAANDFLKYAFPEFIGKGKSCNLMIDNYSESVNLVQLGSEKYIPVAELSNMFLEFLVTYGPFSQRREHRNNLKTVLEHIRSDLMYP